MNKTYLKDCKILLVDDSREIQLYLKKILKNKVTSLVSVDNGIEGLIQFNCNQLDLIISDINLPKLDGLAMASLIRDKNLVIPIIFLSSIFLEFSHFFAAKASS